MKKHTLQGSTPLFNIQEDGAAIPIHISFRIIKIKDNGVLIESSSPDLLALVNNPVLRRCNVQVKIPPKLRPSVIIHNVPNSVTKDDLEDSIAKLVPAADTMDSIVSSQFKVGPRNLNHTNWVLELHPKAWQHMVKKGRLYVHWTVCPVKEFVRITRCYRFGHVVKYCKSDLQCGMCASTDHATKDCRHEQTVERHSCANCLRSKAKSTNHTAFSEACPTYQSRLTDHLSKIEFDGY